jgi:hypothetical protein
LSKKSNRRSKCSYLRTTIALFRQYGSHFRTRLFLLFLDNMAAILER